MITVEELIVQSLYYRLVLVRVRRTPQPHANCPDDDGASATSLQTVGPQSAMTNEAVSSPEGLGKPMIRLCLEYGKLEYGNH